MTASAERPISLTLSELRKAYIENDKLDDFLEVLSEGDFEQGPPAYAFTAVPLSTLDRTPPAPLLLGRLDPSESTVLYGPGGVGKGSLACHWIVQLVGEDRRVLVLDYESHGGEWARRIFGLGGIAALDAVQWLAPLSEGRGPIWQHAAALRAYVIAEGIDFVVIDSAVMACGGDPLKPETAMSFAAALQLVGVPTLTLAHVTKLHDPRYPFGSVFWHNLARVTWSMMQKGEDVLLVCRKANNYLKPAASTVLMTWHDGILGEVAERAASLTLMDRIAEVLTEPMSAADIAAELNDGVDKAEHVTVDIIGRTLRRDLARGTASRVTTAGAGVWRLRFSTSVGIDPDTQDGQGHP